MQPPCPRGTRPTSSNSCSTNRQTPAATYDPTRDPLPGPHTIQQAAHRQGMHEYRRHRTHTRQHACAKSPHSPTPPSVHRYRQLPASACRLFVRQRLPQTALPCNPDHGVCLGAAHRLTHRLHCSDLNPHHCTWSAAPSAPPPPASHPSFFGPLTDALRNWLGGHYVADPADHAWTIAMATGGAALPPHSPPLRHSGGGLHVAAHHVLLALYLHRRGLNLPLPQLPAPRAAAPSP